MQQYVVRDAVHGFIPFDDWDKQVIDHPAVQRLRRIRQLGLTELIYPGASHNRFEHSLGAMHLATRMYDAIVDRQHQFLAQTHNYDEAGLNRDRRIVRFAALLHDVGHSPFSHAGEGLFPANCSTGMRYEHEDYSEAIIRNKLREAIESYPDNDNYEITADMVADLIASTPKFGTPGTLRRMVWKPLVSSQLDADRSDYLLRDSIHCGVSYGRYDLPRILVTLTLALNDSDDPEIAIEEGGIHAAEGLIIARYMMFTQVYFQHTRLAYDHHIEEALRELLARPDSRHNSVELGTYPLPSTPDELDEYLDWDDWKVLGLIKDGMAGEHGERIVRRNHFRRVYAEEDYPTGDAGTFDQVVDQLGPLVKLIKDAGKEWYKFGSYDLLIAPDNSLPPAGRPLSSCSPVVAGLTSVSKKLIYVDASDRGEAGRIVDSVIGG